MSAADTDPLAWLWPLVDTLSNAALDFAGDPGAPGAYAAVVTARAALVREVGKRMPTEGRAAA